MLVHETDDQIKVTRKLCKPSLTPSQFFKRLFGG